MPTIDSTIGDRSPTLSNCWPKLPGPMRALHTQGHLWPSRSTPIIPRRHNPRANQKQLPSNRRSRGLIYNVKAASSAATATPDAEPPRSPADVNSVQLEVPEGIAEPMSEEAVATEQQRRRKLWFAAIKPPMYTVSIIPILVSIGMTSNGCKLLTVLVQASSEHRFLLQLHMLLLEQCPSANASS